MTPQPQKEYIITEEKIQGIETAMSKWMLPDAGEALGKLLRSRPAPSPDVEMLQRLDAHVTKWMKEVHDPETAAQARDKLFEAIRAERDPHLDYVDWDSIEAAYMRTDAARPVLPDKTCDPSCPEEDRKRREEVPGVPLVNVDEAVRVLR